MTEVKGKIHLFEPAEINTLDGLRLEFDNSWMLIRASGTEPAIRVIAESTSKSKVNRLISKSAELVQNLVEANK